MFFLQLFASLMIWNVLLMTVDSQSSERINTDEFMQTENLLLEVTSKNFIDILASAENVLLSFESKLCPACQEFHPKLQQTALKLHSKVTFGIVEGTKEKNLIDYFDIEEYPTLLLFKWGQLMETYEGLLQLAPLIVFLEQQLNPIIQIINGANELEMFAYQSSIVSSQVIVLGIGGQSPLRTNLNGTHSIINDQNAILLEELMDEIVLTHEYDDYAFGLLNTTDTPTILVTTCSPDLIMDCISKHQKNHFKYSENISENSTPDIMNDQLYICCHATLSFDNLLSLTEQHWKQIKQNKVSNDSDYDDPPKSSKENEEKNKYETSDSEILISSIAKNISAWIMLHDIPAIGPMTPLNALFYLRKQQLTGFLYLPLPTDIVSCMENIEYQKCLKIRSEYVETHYADLLKILLYLHQKNDQFRDSIMFCWVALDDYPNEEVNTPQFDIVNYEEGERYVYSESLLFYSDNAEEQEMLQNATKTSLSQFITDVQLKRIAPDISYRAIAKETRIRVFVSSLSSLLFTTGCSHYYGFSKANSFSIGLVSVLIILQYYFPGPLLPTMHSVQHIFWYYIKIIYGDSFDQKTEYIQNYTFEFISWNVILIGLLSFIIILSILWLKRNSLKNHRCQNHIKLIVKFGISYLSPVIMLAPMFIHKLLGFDGG